MDATTPGALNVVPDLELYLLVFVGVLEELNPGLNEGGLVVDADRDTAIRELKMVTSLEKPNGLQKTLHRSPHEKALGRKVVEPKPCKGWGRVEVIESVDDGPNNLPVRALLPGDQAVQLSVVPQEATNLIHELIKLEISPRKIRLLQRQCSWALGRVDIVRDRVGHLIPLLLPAAPQLRLPL